MSFQVGLIKNIGFEVRLFHLQFGGLRNREKDFFALKATERHWILKSRKLIFLLKIRFGV